MDLKTFKGGVAYVTKATNQRQSEPEPFLVQVSVDGVISLVSGDTGSAFIWRTGETTDSSRQRFGIPSKMMVQAVKALRGSKLSVGLSVTDKGLIVSTSSGGEITLPRVFQPVMMNPFPSTSQDPMMSLRKGTLSRWSDAFTVAFGPLEDATQFDIDGRVSATDGYIMFDTHGTLDKALPQPYWVRASFWNALRACRDDATLTFSEGGLLVRSGPYDSPEQLSRRSETIPRHEATLLP